MEKPKGLIIITHSGLRQITDQEVIEALPEHYGKVVTEFSRMAEDLPLEDSHQLHWESYKARQSKWFETDLLPKLEANPDYKILYFGITHIPLAMHMGFLLGDTRKVEVYLCGYQTGKWSWSKAEGMGRKLEFEEAGLPQDDFGGDSEAVIRYGIYAPIAEEDTREVIANAAKEVDIQLKTALEDSFEEPTQLYSTAELYSKAIRILSAKMRRLQAIHVFSAVPTGLAFLMGQAISVNKHPWVHVYHYKRTESPKYRLAMILQEEPSLSLNLSEQDKLKARELRDQIRDHLRETLKRFIKGLQVHSGSWLPRCFPDDSIRFFEVGAWEGIDLLADTYLPTNMVAEGEHPQSADRFYQNGTWYFSEALLHLLFAKLGDNRKVLRAIRLFMLHEAIHFKSHGATSDNTTGIGRYPKIVETLDYQADVYALLHEFAYEIEHDPRKEPKEIFGEAIELMLETMWAFDAQSSPGSMQMRRINRYLIWYFLCLRIESDSCSSLEEILKILSVKPDLEIKGLKAVTDPEGRYIVRLSGYRLHELGIAVVFKNKLRRMGHEADGLPLNELIEGFQSRDGAMIKNVLRSFLASIDN